MRAFFEKAIESLDGTALYVLNHLCWRHSEAEGAAFPSIAGMVSDLKLPRQTLLDAIKRLERHGLIVVDRQTTRGRGRRNRYLLPWLGSGVKGSGPPDHLGNRKVRPTGKNGQAHRQEMVRPTRHEKKENNRKGESPCAKGGDGDEKANTVDRMFNDLLAKNQQADRLTKPTEGNER